MSYFVTFLFVISLTGIFVNGLPKSNPLVKLNRTKTEKCGFMHISITTRKKLAINWSYAQCKNHPDKIVLYKRKSCGVDEMLCQVKIGKNNKVGVKITDVPWNITIFPRGWHPNDGNASKCHCYKYFLTSYKNDTVLNRQCLKVNPIWMAKNKRYLRSLRIGQVFFPGTHGSGKFKKHQNYNFWGQLVFGIRYFDIVVGMQQQPGKNKTDNNFTDFIRVERLYTELGHIRNFLNRTEKEVIILDFSHFSNMGSGEHEQLIGTILRYINETLMVPSDFSNNKNGPTLGKIWKAKKRVIINYRNARMCERYKFLWNSILVKEGDKSTPEKLKEYILKEIPNIWYNETMSRVSGTIGTNKKLIDAVNPIIANWYRTKNIQRYMNIFAVDFFEGTRLPLDCVWVNKYYKVTRHIKNDYKNDM